MSTWPRLGGGGGGGAGRGGVGGEVGEGRRGAGRRPGIEDSSIGWEVEPRHGGVRQLEAGMKQGPSWRLPGEADYRPQAE
jgi:hypothetical protein